MGAVLLELFAELLPDRLEPLDRSSKAVRGLTLNSGTNSKEGGVDNLRFKLRSATASFSGGYFGASLRTKPGSCVSCGGEWESGGTGNTSQANKPMLPRPLLNILSWD